MSERKKLASTKTKRVDAEKACEHYARVVLDCVCTRRPVRTQFQSIDFFGADVVGKRRDGSHVYIQVTTGQANAARVRRRKLEAYPWHPSDAVYLLQLCRDDSQRPIRWFFNIHRYVIEDIASALTEECPDRVWRNSDEQMDVPRIWFKAYKEDFDYDGK